MKESAIQKQILDYLAAKHVLAFRMQTGAIKLDKRFVRFGVAGMADILACPKMLEDDWGVKHPVFLWLECKTANGKQSDLQKSFQKMVESHGHTYRIVRSIEDLLDALL